MSYPTSCKSDTPFSWSVPQVTFSFPSSDVNLQSSDSGHRGNPFVSSEQQSGLDFTRSSDNTVVYSPLHLKSITSATTKERSGALRTFSIPNSSSSLISSVKPLQRPSSLASEHPFSHPKGIQCESSSNEQMSSLGTSSITSSVSNPTFSFAASLEKTSENLATPFSDSGLTSTQHSVLFVPETKKQASSKTITTVSCASTSKRKAESSSNVRRRASLETGGGSKSHKPSSIITHLTSIICKGIPPEINNKSLLVKHFSQFGLVKRISCNQKHQQAAIRFDDHASAENAKRNGTKISPSSDAVSIFWFQDSSRKGKAHPTTSSDNQDVKAELKAMMEAVEDHKILARPETNVTESIPHRKMEKSKSKTSPLKLLQQKTITAEDCFIVLDVRDKLLRSNFKKHSNLAIAKDLFGTCCDMCPEKERYGRFAKKCLSVFEMKDFDSKSSVLEHQLIVKEYSRSSADQEEPLPHELRPVSTLQMTMDYILCNVVNKRNNDMPSVGEWYDFIWNRTRAIRKDITQQRLCNISCVNIVEKCARFHIYCAAALCDEDVATFDPKINDENLTKCLQTLKHMYQDLAEKHMDCPNEPEFRAYDILLSLKEGDTLRHVQRLRVDVRNTAEVHFAVSTALAFSNNNYVRFFKLVMEASYLNSCILQRYFREVRLQAMLTILKAFCAPNRTEQYPIESLCSMLKFGSVSDAIEFCKSLGFTVEHQFVLLDRSAFVTPVSSFGPNRSAVVENKRTVSIAEIINNGPLPKNPLHSYSPHDSFNSKGYLKKEAFQALDQRKTLAPKPKDEQIDATKLTVKDIVATTPETSVMPTTNDLKCSVLKAEQMDVPEIILPMTCEDGGNAEKLDPDICIISEPVEIRQAEISKEEKETHAAVILEHIISDVLSNLLYSVSSVFFDMKRNQIEKEKLIELQNIAAEDAADCILAEVVQEEVTALAIKESSFAKEKLVQDLCSSLSEDLLEETVHECHIAIATEVYGIEKGRWMDHMKNAQKSTNILRARKALLMWHRESTRKKLEACRNLFPSCPPLRSRKRNLNESALKNPACSLLGKKHITQQLDAGVLYHTIREELSWQPIDLVSLFETCIRSGIRLPKLSPKTYYWKLLLVYEEGEENTAYSVFTNWLKAKFTKGFVKQNSASHLCTHSLYWLTNIMGDRIAICVKSFVIDNHVEARVSELKQKFLLEGTCAVLLCAKEASLVQDLSTKDSIYSAIQNLLTSKRPIPPVSLYCFVISDTSSPTKNVGHFLCDLKRQQLLHEFEICSIDLMRGVYILNEQIFSGVEWLIKQCPPFPDVMIESINDFIQNTIVTVFNVIYQDIAHKRNQGSFVQVPQCIVKFFNKVMKHRASVLSSNFLNVLSWPLPEVPIDVGNRKEYFPWNNIAGHQAEIQKKIDALLLPIFMNDPPGYEDAVSYVRQIISISKSDPFHLISSVLHLLAKVPQSAENETWAEIPWADIVYECVQYMATCLNHTNCNDAQNIQVFFHSEELNSFDLASEWQNVLLSYSFSPKRKCHWIEDSLHESTQKRRKEEEKELCFVDDLVQIKDVDPCGSVSQLEQHLTSEKLESDAFLVELEQCAALQSCIFPSLLSDNLVEDSVHGVEKNSPSEKLTSTSKNVCAKDLLEELAELKRNLETEKREEKLFYSKLKAILT